VNSPVTSFPTGPSICDEGRLLKHRGCEVIEMDVYGAFPFALDTKVSDHKRFQPRKLLQEAVTTI